MKTRCVPAVKDDHCRLNRGKHFALHNNIRYSLATKQKRRESAAEVHVNVKVQHFHQNQGMITTQKQYQGGRSSQPVSRRDRTLDMITKSQHLAFWYNIQQWNGLHLSNFLFRILYVCKQLVCVPVYVNFTNHHLNTNTHAGIHTHAHEPKPYMKRSKLKSKHQSSEKNSPTCTKLDKFTFQTVTWSEVFIETLIKVVTY